jgi:hypothetical protein
MTTNPYDMPAGGGLPDGNDYVPGAAQAAEGPDTYYGTVACTIGISLTANSRAEAQAEMTKRIQQLMDRLGNVEGFRPQMILLLDPDTGLAVEAFLGQLEQS